MATFYGKWVATDDFRCILEATVSNSSATSCTVRLVVKIQSNYASAQNSGHASSTCNGTTRSGEAKYSAGRTTTVMTETFTVARGSSSRSVSVSGRVWQTNYNSAYSKGSTATGKVTIPAIDYSAPAAPSGCTASRASDAKATVKWTNGSTSTTSPRSNVLIERQSGSGSFSQIASLGASTSNYTDSSLKPNGRYRYRVRSKGAGGTSGYATSGYIFTTPSAPRSVEVSAKEGTAVDIDVDGGNAPYAERFEVESSLNGSPFSPVGTFAEFPITADIGGGSVVVRARAVRGDLASPWTESEAITTITPPLAPSVHGLDMVYAIGSDAVVAWGRNHPDGSPQTAAQVEVTAPSGPAPIADVEGAGTSYAVRVTEAGTYAVRVRTKGAHADWGAWSAKATFTAGAAPTAAFTFPGADGMEVDTVPVELAWDVVAPSGVSRQNLELIRDDGTVAHSVELGPSARSYELSSSTYLPENHGEFALRLELSDGIGLSATAAREFIVDYLAPGEPSAEVGYDAGGLYATVDAWFPEPGDMPAVRMEVSRVTDGESLLLSGDIGNGEQVIDRLPPLNTAYEYVVTAYSEAGTASSARVPALLDSHGMEAFNFGHSADEVLVLGLSPSASSDASHGGELFHFALGPDAPSLPMFYADGDLDVSGSRSYAVIGPEGRRAVDAVRRDRRKAVCWMRDFWGGRHRVKADWGISSGNDGIHTVSAKLTEVVWEEPGNG